MVREESGIRQPVLLEVNIAGEDTKTGVAPAEVAALAAAVGFASLRSA